MNARAVAWLFVYWLELVCFSYMPLWAAWGLVACIAITVFECVRCARIKL